MIRFSLSLNLKYSLSRTGAVTAARAFLRRHTKSIAKPPAGCKGPSARHGSVSFVRSGATREAALRQMSEADVRAMAREYPISSRPEVLGNARAEERDRRFAYERRGYAIQLSCRCQKRGYQR